MKFALLTATILISAASARASGLPLVESKTSPMHPTYSAACIDHQGGAYSVGLSGAEAALVCENGHCAAPAGTILQDATSKSGADDLTSPQAMALLDLLKPLVAGIDVSQDPVCAVGPSLYRFDGLFILCSSPIRDTQFESHQIRLSLSRFLSEGSVE